LQRESATRILDSWSDARCRHKISPFNQLDEF
jgi:hypothetical protein